MHSSDSLEPRPAVVAAVALKQTAHELQQRSGAAEAVPGLPVTLEHVEEALARLATAMQLTAQAVTQECVDGSDRPTPEVRAVSWHLYFLAARLRASREACPAPRDWARRMLDARDTRADARPVVGGRMPAMLSGAGRQAHAR